MVTGPAPGQALTPDEVLRRGPVQETNESLYEGDDDDDRTDIASIATNVSFPLNDESTMTLSELLSRAHQLLLGTTPTQPRPPPHS